ncbi:MAG: acyltransferase [Bacteroidaceae bacterium]
MTPVSPLSSQPRIVWLDITRFIAMFTIVCCHSADPFNFFTGSGIEANNIKFWGAIYGSALRPCVPLFVMITGALLLPVIGDTAHFYKKRISRVFFPFLIWSVLYYAFPWFVGVLGIQETLVQDFFPCAGAELTEPSFGGALNRIIGIPLNFTYLAVQMWYIYLLIGLYLYMPIFSAWIERASERAKGLFLLAWAVTLFIPYYRVFANQYLWGTCSWNEFGMLYAFAGFNGYLLLGHYLRHHDFSIKQTLGFGIPMFAIGYIITFFGFRSITAQPDATEPMIELFFTFCSPNVALMTIPVFLLSKKINIQNDRLRAALQNLTLCGFGIYMIHYFLVGPTYLLCKALSIPIPLHIPIAAIFAFSGSWIIVYFVHKWMGKSAKYIMG